jgi:NAD(P)-dependent dehydrogenase (short-subunit alcohol dehydrogenase family)
VQRVCITGANRGIGLAFAKGYLKEGARVFGTVRNPDDGNVRELATANPDRFTAISMDVADRESVFRGAEEIGSAVDSLDILINNAGTNTFDNEKRPEEISEENIRKVFDVNTLGPLRVVQAVVPLLRRSDGGKVVMISSTGGSIAHQQGGRVVPYCVSKAGLNMLTKLLYFHLREDGIAALALHPGWVRTDMGGPGGALSPQQSVAEMMKVIGELTTESKLFVDYRGEELPW